MELYNKRNNYKLYHGSMLDMLEVIEPNSIDSIVTDSPYELNFMGKGWDNAGISFNKDTWQKCYEVLKPGGYMLAFGGTRTYHRIACAIEDAGFEIRDCIMWLYGSGFPKSMALDKAIEGKLTTGNANKNNFHNLNGEQVDKHHYGFTTQNKEMGIRPKDYTTEEQSSTYLKSLEATTDLAKQFKGWGTCLKPAYEPIIVARKPFKGSLVDNVIENGVGGLNIDECRVSFKNGEINSSIVRYQSNKKQIGNNGWKHTNRGANFDKNTEKSMELGRFPANVIHDGSKEVCSNMPYTKAQKRTQKYNKQTEYTNTYTGSASRYFYCAKASKKDRDEGLDMFEEKIDCDRNPELSSANVPMNRSNNARKNIHPTVKPTELMQYLVRLVSPKGATILDPFMGSGSTGKAIMYENKEHNSNYKFIGIELIEEYLQIANARIDYILPKENDYTIDNYIFEVL